MFLLCLCSLAGAKEVSVPGAYSDLVDSELVLTFAQKDDFDSFVIFTNSENFKINDRDLKHVYTNPTTLTIKSNKNYLNYSFIQLQKGKCDKLDFILNKYSNDWVDIDPSFIKDNLCFVFANSHISKSIFYMNYIDHNILIYDNFFIDGKSYKILPKKQEIPLDYTTLLVQFPIQSVEFDYKFGINNGTNKSQTDIYHIPSYDSYLLGKAIVDDIIEFKYGNYDIDVHDQYILTIPAGSYLLLTKHGELNLSVNSGKNVIRSSSPYSRHYIAYSFYYDGYIRFNGNNHTSFVVIKNSTNLHCERIITMFGKINYQVEYDPNSSYCIYAVTNKGNIKISQDKNAKYYDVKGNEISYQNKFEDSVVVSIYKPDIKSSIKFTVGGNTDFHYVIDDTKYSNAYYAVGLLENTHFSLNHEQGEDREAVIDVEEIGKFGIGLILLFIIGTAIGGFILFVCGFLGYKLLSSRFRSNNDEDIYLNGTMKIINSESSQISFLTRFFQRD